MIGRYSAPEMSALFSDEARLGLWLEVELLALEAWAKLGVVPDAELLAQTHALAAELAKGATRALAGAKRLIYGGVNESLETQIENEIRSIYEMASTDDTREAIKAFNEKRTPVFKGR